MKIEEMLPGLDAEALKTVRINAVRLSANGTAKQKEQANAALKLIDEEVARRQAALPPPEPRKPRRTKKAMAAEAANATEAS